MMDPLLVADGHKPRGSAHDTHLAEHCAVPHPLHYLLDPQQRPGQTTAVLRFQHDVLCAYSGRDCLAPCAWPCAASSSVRGLIPLICSSWQFWTLRYVDPATYQILGNLKIVTTGVLFRALLQRRLSVLQWIALLLLMIGATTSQVPFHTRL